MWGAKFEAPKADNSSKSIIVIPFSLAQLFNTASLLTPPFPLAESILFQLSIETIHFTPWIWGDNFNNSGIWIELAKTTLIPAWLQQYSTTFGPKVS